MGRPGALPELFLEARSQGQAEAARGRQEQPQAIRSSQEQPGARSSQMQQTCLANCTTSVDNYRIYIADSPEGLKFMEIA